MGRSRTLTRAALASLVRERFPEKPPGAYLDTAAIGLVPRDVAVAVASCYEALGSGTRGATHWQPVVERATRALASEFGVADNAISFMASAGEAINAIARAIPWRPGDEVLTLTGEFPTVTLPWSELGAGVRMVEVAPLPGDDRLGALLAAIGPRTRAVTISHVSSFTGTVVDLDTLGRACARVGALLVCDGAQSAGAIPVNLSFVDFYVATGYKWLLSGFGTALVISKTSSLWQLRPTLLGYGNQAPPPALTYGHLNLAGVYALEAAAAVRRDVGLEAVAARIATLARGVRAGAMELGFSVAAAPERSAGIISLEGLADVGEAVARLAHAGVSVAERAGYLRISPNFYTADSEIDGLLRALKEMPHRPAPERG